MLLRVRVIRPAGDDLRFAVVGITLGLNGGNIGQHAGIVIDMLQVIFHIHAVADLDEALALLTGVPAGVRDAQGRFPPDSVNGRVEARLEAFAQAAHRAGHRD